MRIAEVRPHPVSIRLDQPLWTAHEPLRDSSVVLVEVLTDDGLRGVGHVHGAPLAEICQWVSRLGEAIVGMDAAGHVAVWEKLVGLTSPRPGGMRAVDGLPPPLPRRARPQIMAAIGGIDIALWDIKGKAAGMPVWRLLGGSPAPVFTYATGGYYREGADPRACADELAAFAAAGFRAVKLKCCGESLEDEVARIAATRRAIGPDVGLLLDMNAAYDVQTCIRFARAVEPFAIGWLEEPLHWYLQAEDFATLARATRIPIAHGEREMTRHTIRELIAAGALRYVQFDSTRAAGFTESLRIAHLAEQHGVLIAPHTVPEIHAHLCAAFPGSSYGVESHGDAARDPVSHGLYLASPQVRDSHVHLGEAPGFGLEIDWAFVARHRA